MQASREQERSKQAVKYEYRKVSSLPVAGRPHVATAGRVVPSTAMAREIRSAMVVIPTVSGSRMNLRFA